MGEKAGKGREITITADIRPMIERPPLHVAVSGTPEDLDGMLVTLAEVGGRIRGNPTACEIVSGNLKMGLDRLRKDEDAREKVPRPTLDPDEVRKAQEEARREGSPTAEPLNIAGGEKRRKEGLQMYEELHIGGLPQEE